MGMAAGQARLLTLTARLNNNELRAMQLSNAKIRLADQTQKVGEEYVNALNESQLMYSTYDTNGNVSYERLTGNSLSFYGPLKNQYGLVNAAGQIMVSELDGKNFEESDNLEEFLDKYGLLGSLDQGKVVQVKNPAYDTAWDEYNKKYQEWKAQEPDKMNPIYWEEGVSETSSELYDSFLWSTAICYAAAMMALSKDLGLPGETLTDSEGNPVVTYDPEKFSWSIYSADGSGSILHTESSGSTDCYSHVLSHLLNLGTYTTTTGQSITISNNYGSNGAYAHWWSDDYNNRGSRAEELADVLSENADKVYHCCAEDDVDITENSSEVEKLMSDYYFDENGNIQTKTLQQKIVDLNYAMVEGLMSEQQSYDAIQHFVNHDLKVLNETEDVFKQEEYDNDVAAWEATKPQEPDVEPYLEKKVRQLTDSDKGQWYINLWHRMNGESDYKSGYMNLDKYDENFDGWVSDSKVNENYVVLEDGLMNSPEWLQFALEHGVITLEKVQFSSPSQEGDGLTDVQWVSTIYTSIGDIVEQKDENAATKAEVWYNHQMKEIEAKDKEYDNQIKLLDTEHNALQTEYDSIKGTIEKNIERTFKAFS